MARRAQVRREDLRRQDEGGAVGPEVGEEEGEGVHEHQPYPPPGADEAVVEGGDDEHEAHHHGEAQELDGLAADDVDEGDGEPVARQGAAERDDGVRAADAVGLLEGAHGARPCDPLDVAEDLLLEDVLGVEDDVQHEPAGDGAGEVRAVAAGEAAGEDAVVAPVPGDALHLVRLARDVHLQHPGHVARGLVGVAGHQRRVARRLRHPHPPVVGEAGRDGADHEDDPPRVVGLRRGGRRGVLLVRRRGEARLERGRDDERDNAAGEDAEAFHGEDGGDEAAPGALVGVLGHDGGGERVVAADADAEPEAEEAERGHDAAGGAAEGEAGQEGAQDHEHDGLAVELLAADLVAEPAEEELPHDHAAEGDAGDGGLQPGRDPPGLPAPRDVVVDAAQELGHQGDAEEVVRVGEEAHAGDDHRADVVPLRLRDVQRVQHLQLLQRHCRRQPPRTLASFEAWALGNPPVLSSRRLSFI